MVWFGLFVVFALVTFVLFILLVIDAVLLLVKKIRHRDATKTKRRGALHGVLTCVGLALCIGTAALSQTTATTPAMRNEGGNIEEGSIAELSAVSLNGRTEWISIRGHDTTKPLLLFLAGGPGGTQMAATRFDLAALEEHFVVVNWDQPGSGKSFDAVAQSELSLTTYLQDGYALAQYLSERFEQQKIYLLGESWGSALGIMLASEHPEQYHAVIGTGQMVNFAETERLDYHLALQLAEEAGDIGLMSTLKANGEPPYYEGNVVQKSGLYLQYLSGIMSKNPQISNAGYNTLRDLGAEEYGVMDKINYLRGLLTTFNTFYPQLYDIDLREDYAHIDVPVYLFLGRHDINAPLELSQDYFDKLEAPHKELVWFEHSGHSPWINESERFATEVMRVTSAL